MERPSSRWSSGNPRLSAADIVVGSERVLWRLWHRAIDLVLLAVTISACFLLVSFLARSAHPVFAVVNLDRGQLGPQLTGAILASSDFRLITTAGKEMEEALRADTVDAYLVFPIDFSARVARDQVLRPEIHMAAGMADPGVVLASFSRSVFSSAGTGGLQIQPKITYVGGSTVPAGANVIAGALGLAVFLFGLLLPGITVDTRSGERSLATVAGTVLGCSLVSLIFGLLLFIIYVAALHLPSLAPTALVALVTFLGAAAATLLGTIVQRSGWPTARLTWLIPAIVLPQLLFAGLVFPTNAEPAMIRTISSVLPLTATIDAFRATMLRAAGLTSAALERDAASLVGFVLLALGVLSALAKGGRVSEK